MHGRGGSAALGAPRGAGQRRPAPVTRPTGGPVDRRAARPQRLRPAAPPLRRSARPRPRRDARSRRRHDRECRRQGREERRGLRPRATRLRIRRTARLHRARQLPFAPAAEGDAHDRRRDGGRGLRGRRASRIAAAAERARCPPPRSCGGAVRRIRPRGSGAGRNGPETRRSARRPRRAVWDESRQRQADAQGRLRFAPGELAATLERLDDAIVRPASGVAYVPEPAAEELDSLGFAACSTRSADSSILRESSPRDPRVRRRLRPLRVLPADLPDVRPLERGDGLAARAHPPHGRPTRRNDRAERHGHPALRPLPRMHGLRVVVPVGRSLRQTHREHARGGRGRGRAAAGRSLRPRAAVPASPLPGPHARGAHAGADRPSAADAGAAPAARRDRSALARARHRRDRDSRFRARHARASVCSRAASSAQCFPT